jgi:hypothetical protein
MIILITIIYVDNITRDYRTNNKGSAINWMIIGKKPEVPVENLSQCKCVHHKSHVL